MTTATDLTTSWQEVASAGSIIATLEIDGSAEFAFSASAPTDDGHPVDERTRIGGNWNEALWVKLSDTDSTGTAYVDQTSSEMSVGSGVSLVRFAPSLTVVSL